MRILRFLHDGHPVLAIEHDEDVELCDGTSLDPKPTGTRVAKPSTDVLLAPIMPTDILCIGLNYRDHAAETNSTTPDNPMLFIKSSNSLGHPKDAVVLPGNSGQVDYEAELVIVIGRDVKNVSVGHAMQYVFGYTIANDVSARDWQKDKRLNGGQFSRGKSFDGFCPLGPAIVTADELDDVSDLPISLTLNGQTMQASSTSELIFDVPTIVSSLSQTMTVRAGSVILTGTPAGVGAARMPPVFLKDGDVTRASVNGIGTLETRFVAA